MKITKRQLRRIIREEMNPGAQGTPDEIMGDASSESDSGSGFSPEKKAAMGFINNSMGATPSADQLAGMDPQIQDYARQQGVGAGALKHQLNKILPSTGQHPDFQVDSASGSVSSTDGRKVYGEGMKITKRQLKRIIREQMASTSYQGNLDPEIALVNTIRDLVGNNVMFFDFAHELQAAGFDGAEATTEPISMVTVPDINGKMFAITSKRNVEGPDHVVGSYAIGPLE